MKPNDQSVEWQQGFGDGFDGKLPAIDHTPLYRNGWITGHNEAHQCSMKESEGSFARGWRMKNEESK
jgi:hypothetical protein